jgi:tRNA modification GTPase
MTAREETICAPASGTGGAIAIIRVSGPDSIDICGKVFSPAANNDIREQKGYSILYGEIRSDSEIIDDVLVSFFRAPHSYTGEDSVEISCHSSKYIIRRILELLIQNGAKAALPGEFTQRAFFNGKMDLSQAEAIADVIASSTKAAHKLAINQMRGGFSEEIAGLRKELLNFASLIELELDFGEEDVEFANRNDLKTIILKVKKMADDLAGSFMIGNAVKNGIPVAIVGKPNSGKSTLLNALLKEEKAIVSDIPGTTRDTIEDTMVIDGLEYRFIDTAGLRETTDVIETMGIQRTHEKIKQASVILLIDEITEKPSSVLTRAEEIRRMIKEPDQKLLILINKTDTATTGRINDFAFKSGSDQRSLLFISAKEKTGLDELRERLSDISVRERINSDEVIVTNLRH